MWDSSVAWVRLIWDTGTEVRELRTDVEALQISGRNTHDLIRALAVQNELPRKDNEILRRELQSEREKRADELEKIELRLP